MVTDAAKANQTDQPDPLLTAHSVPLQEASAMSAAHPRLNAARIAPTS